MVLARYRDSVHAISVQYSQSTRWTGADPVLAASIADDEARMPEAAHDLGDRNQTEPYRRKLTPDSPPAGGVAGSAPGGQGSRAPYSTAEELLDDLDLVDGALRRQRGALFANGKLLELRRQVAAFDFYGYAIDVRLHAARLREVASGILRQCGQLDGSLDDLDEDAAVGLLARAMQQRGRTSAH